MKGHYSETKSLIKNLLSIDPLTAINQSLPGCFHWMEDRLDLAIVYFEKWCQMDPDNIWARWYLAQMYVWNKQLDKAYDCIDHMEKEWPQNIFTKLILIFKNALEGDKSNVQKFITEDIKKWCWNDFHLPWYIAECYSLLGEKQEALKWFEQAINKGWINYPLFNRHDPFLDNIRKEPRFKKLMEKVKHEWENFKV